MRPENLPLEMPTFTLKTIRDAIPPHCFKRDLGQSMLHLFRDCVQVAIIFYLGTFINQVPAMFHLPPWVIYILWPIYWVFQGCQMTGLWVLAHECGHQAFSDYEIINNIVGTIFHSILLVPYHPWRITHGKHHNNTG